MRNMLNDYEKINPNVKQNIVDYFLKIDGIEGESTDAPAYQGWWVDADGAIWVATETRGLRSFPVHGLDAHGIPQWPATGLKVFPHPAGFKQVKVIEESFFSLDYLAPEPAAQAMAEDLGLSAAEARDMTAAVVSVRVAAIKPAVA